MQLRAQFAAFFFLSHVRDQAGPLSVADAFTPAAKEDEAAEPPMIRSTPQGGQKLYPATEEATCHESPGTAFGKPPFGKHPCPFSHTSVPIREIVITFYATILKAN